MEFNADLVGDLARQRVVLFLGAGVSASAKTQSGNPLKGWGAFLSSVNDLELKGDVKGQVEKLIESGDYLLACEIIQGEVSDRWENLLRSEFGQAAEPSELHTALWSLRQRIILTTNFDKIIETSLAASGGSHYYPVVISKLEPRVFRMLKDHDTTYVIKLHGTIDDRNGMVFSRSEYIKNAFGSVNYAALLDVLMLNYTFLYVGFSMEDPAIVSLMEMYAFKYPDARPHFIFTSESLPGNIEEINKRLRKLMAIRYDSSDNHRRLPDVIRALADDADRRRLDIAAQNKSRSISS